MMQGPPMGPPLPALLPQSLEPLTPRSATNAPLSSFGLSDTTSPHDFIFKAPLDAAGSSPPTAPRSPEHPAAFTPLTTHITSTHTQSEKSVPPRARSPLSSSTTSASLTSPPPFLAKATTKYHPFETRSSRRNPSASKEVPSPSSIP